MKRFLIAAGAAATLLLGGCASTIRSEVTTFHVWPADLAEKSYVFEAPPAQDDTLELRSYQNLVRGELAKLGFRDAAAGEQPKLKVAMRFTTTDVPVRVLMPTYPMSYYNSPRFMFMSPYHRMYGSRWGGRRYWGGGWYSPFYDPFWDPMPMYQEVTRHVYKRELRVAIKSAADGKQLFDVTVHNNSGEMSTPAVMPALVQSAFTGFPGVSGQARRVELKREG
jgi:hypothetical protein